MKQKNQIYSCIISYKRISLYLAWIVLFIPYVSKAACTVSCDVTFSPSSVVNLGSYDPYNYTQIVQALTFSITCGGTGAGCNQSANVSITCQFTGTSTRQLSYLTNQANYNLCTSSSCTTTLSNSNYSSVNYSFIPSVGRTDSTTIYVVVPVQPLSTAGNYTNNVNVALNYTQY